MDTAPDEAAWLKHIQERVMSGLEEEEEQGEGNWTTFVDNIAVELRHSLQEDAEEAKEAEKDIVATIKAVIVLGLTRKAKFEAFMESCKWEAPAFINRLTSDEKVKQLIKGAHCISLFAVGSIVLEAGLVSNLKEVLNDSRRASLELEKGQLPDDNDVGAPEYQSLLGSYMKLVNREESINKLLKHAAGQYLKYLGGKESENLQWAACSGGPGLGKTTFCRKAFTTAAEAPEDSTLWSDVPDKDRFRGVVDACVSSGRQYRIAFSNPNLTSEEVKHPEMSLAWRLSKAVIKRGLAYPERHDGQRQLYSVLEEITRGKKESLVVINFDETNKLQLDPSSDDYRYLNRILGIIRKFNSLGNGFIFCIFSGTNVRKQHDLLKAASGGIPPLEMPLPLLGSDHVVEVLEDLLKRAPGIGQCKASEISKENKKLLGFALKVLGGVPRYIEMLVHSLGELNSSKRFAWASFRDALASDTGRFNVHSQPHSLLERVRNLISLRYDWELAHILSEVPCQIVVGYSLFEWPVTRETLIGNAGEKYKVEDLERNGMVFLQQIESGSSNASDESELKLLFPLVLLLRTVRGGPMDPPMLLKNFGVMLSSEENARNSLAIFAMKAAALHEIDGCVKLGKLLPFEDSNAGALADVELQFNSFNIMTAKHRIEVGNWADCFKALKTEGGIIMNAKGATFSDMIMVPVIAKDGFHIHFHFQEKQNDVTKQQLHNNSAVAKVAKDTVITEHNKCRVKEKHLFVMITDEGVAGGVRKSLAENELLVTYDTQEKAIGSLLALLRSFNHQQGKQIVWDLNEVKKRKRDIEEEAITKKMSS